MTVKFELFTQLTDVSKTQRMMKDSLALAAGKGDVKFVAAKNYKIGGKMIPLFLVVDASAQAKFLTHLKAQSSMVAASSGVAEVTKSISDNKHTICVKSASGSLSANTVSTMVSPAVGHDAKYEATTPERAQAEKEHLESSSREPKPTSSGKSSLPDSVLSQIRERGQKDDAATPQGKGGQPARKQGGDVQKSDAPEWAKKEYKRLAKRLLMASMTSDGKIGSVYFGDGSRIRTTHDASPTREQHEKNRVVQFNVDEMEAQKEYLSTHPQDPDYRGYDDWLRKRLVGVTLGKAPNWAIILDRPLKAHDRAQKGNPSDNEKLIEIFKSINGDYEGWHPSRGAAVRFDTDKQTISVLQAGIEYIDAKFPPVSDHESRDPVIAQREKALQHQIQAMRQNPSQHDLDALRHDPTIHARMIALGLTDQATIDELNRDDQINKQITKLYSALLTKLIEKDPVHQQRLAEIAATRKNRNTAFYDFVKNRLPQSEIVKAMREPTRT